MLCAEAKKSVALSIALGFKFCPTFTIVDWISAITLLTTSGVSLSTLNLSNNSLVFVISCAICILKAG